MECVEPERVEELQIALDELAALLSKYVGAEVINKQIVNREKKEAILEE